MNMLLNVFMRFIPVTRENLFSTKRGIYPKIISIFIISKSEGGAMAEMNEKTKGLNKAKTGGCVNNKL